MGLRGVVHLNELQIEQCLDLCAEASKEILRHYESSEMRTEVKQKEDRTPLTKADLASHRLLFDGLARVTPKIPVLSEESDEQAFQERHKWPVLWMVDPLDGTREFLDRTSEFTINLALIDDHRPVFGVVYCPVTALAYLGAPGVGAWRGTQQPEGWLYEEVRTRPLDSSRATLLASKRHKNEKLLASIDWVQERRLLDRQNFGSALKFCELAEGRGDWYPRFSPCSEWDVAAGDALVTGAGGAVLAMDGTPMSYNGRDTVASPHFLAVADARDDLWLEYLGWLQ
ncbi:MAG: 3'(2'),5'-bisphosphate nucleotidase CysQ [Pseudomonadota bacterium]